MRVDPTGWIRSLLEHYDTEEGWVVEEYTPPMTADVQQGGATSYYAAVQFRWFRPMREGVLPV